jgi:hypothetical protein
MDAMALVRKYGKPDIFLTMTCNPNWDEINRELYPGQTPQDRPDLVVRVFRAKLEELKDRLLQKDILGKVKAYVYVVEFQKRAFHMPTSCSSWRGDSCQGSHFAPPMMRCSLFTSRGNSFLLGSTSP